MIYYKTDAEVELIRQSCLLVSKTLAEVGKHIQPGVTTNYLDKIGEEYIRDNGGVPAFKGYKGFPNSFCISVNEVVVHGIPSERVINEGDVVSLDCGVVMNEFYGDSAYTFPVGEVKPEVLQLLKVTMECLELGVEKAKAGNRIGDISFAVQEHAEKYKYGVVRELVGHGLGKKLHEDPEVPNFGRKGSGPKLLPGLVIAIEPMITLGNRRVIEASDGWTISTADNKPAAHYEHTIAVLKDRTEVLTTFDFIKSEVGVLI